MQIQEVLLVLQVAAEALLFAGLCLQVPAPRRLFLFAGALGELERLLAFGKFFLLVAPALVHPKRNVAVDFGAGDLFQQGPPVIGGGLEEGGEISLGEEHGAGEALEVQPRDFFDPVWHVGELSGEDFPRIFKNFVFGGLEFSVGALPGGALAPVASEASFRGLEGHFGEALAGVAGHDLVGRFGHPVQAGRGAVESQADGVQQGGFPRSRGTGDGEDPLRSVGGMGKVHDPFAPQGVQIFEVYPEDAHVPLLSSPRGSSSAREAMISR